MELRELKSICYETVHIYTKGIPWWEVPLAYLILVLAVPILCLLGIVVIPVKCFLFGGSVVPNSNCSDLPPAKPIDREDESKCIDDYLQRRNAVLFYSDRDKFSYTPVPGEVFFYSPTPCSELEALISINLDRINSLFSKSNLYFIFPPDFSNQPVSEEVLSQYSYYNPRIKEILTKDIKKVLSYDDIKAALSIPDKVNGPSLIRYKGSNSKDYIFSFKRLESKDFSGLVAEIEDYLNNVGSGALYHLKSDETIKKEIEGKPADDRFEEDVYLIGKEIRERIDKLRAKGLTELAIRKLVGDSSNDPSPLRIDRNYRLFLTAYGNKEIVLSPIHKAVFFLFLNHPEGIFFKDLPSYRDELGSIYRNITSREDTKAVEESIDKLADPYNNSINEKCARIKNAFVSEFREEIAQWYFIKGSKGQKKAILLPRNLVTWETA